MAGGCAGIASPIFVAACTTRFEGIWGWRAVFFFTFIQCVIGVIIWAIWQVSDIIPKLNEPAY